MTLISRDTYVDRLAPSFCVCGNDLGLSVDPAILTVQKNRHSILVTQSAAEEEEGEGGVFSAQDFEYVLRNVRFAHDPERPLVDSYSATVSVLVGDGLLTSNTAVTTIDVTVSNTPPAVFINGETTASAVMADGEGSGISLFQPDTYVELFEDTSTIEEVLIRLTNPSHVEEGIGLSPPSDLPDGITVVNNGSVVVLTGPATPTVFSRVLTDSTLYYRYPAMESILGGDRPVFTTR